MSTTPGYQLVSTLQKDSEDAMAYEWSFKVPHRSILQQLDSNSCTKFKFSTELPYKVQHHTLNFVKRPNELELEIYYLVEFEMTDDDIVLDARTIQLELFKGADEKEIVSMPSHYRRMYMERNEQTGQVMNCCGWHSFVYIDENIWDYSVDMLKLKFTFKCSKVALGPINIPANKEVDTKKYFLSKSLSDVTLVTNNNESFPAHKFILSCKSRVFEKMFEHENMKENLEGYVKIVDIEPEVLTEMLHFIYTGELSSEEIKDSVFFGLLKSAEKYDLDDLKRLCADQIYARISSENALDVYALGDMYNEPRIMKKASNIIKTDNRKRVILDDPEILQNIAILFPEYSTL